MCKWKRRWLYRFIPGCSKSVKWLHTIFLETSRSSWNRLYIYRRDLPGWFFCSQCVILLAFIIVLYVPVSSSHLSRLLIVMLIHKANFINTLGHACTHSQQCRREMIMSVWKTFLAELLPRRKKNKVAHAPLWFNMQEGKNPGKREWTNIRNRERCWCSGSLFDCARRISEIFLSFLFDFLPPTYDKTADIKLISSALSRNASPRTDFSGN